MPSGYNNAYGSRNYGTGGYGMNSMQGLNQGMRNMQGRNSMQGMKNMQGANPMHGMRNMQGANSTLGMKSMQGISQGMRSTPGTNYMQGSSHIQGTGSMHGAGSMQGMGGVPGASQGMGQGISPPPNAGELGIRYESAESFFSGGGQIGNSGQIQSGGQIKPAEQAKSEEQDRIGIQEAGHTKHDSESHQHNIPSIIPESAVDDISRFIQNERNGSLFYKYLSTLAPNERKRQALENIGGTSRRNSQMFGKLYKKYKGTEYEINDTLVDTTSEFKEGVRWAVWEESLAIKDLAGLYEEMESDETLRIINSIMSRKIGDLGLLLCM